MPGSSSEQLRDVSEYRAAMVESLNKAIEVFCTHSEEAFDRLMTSALRPLAETMEVSRIFVDRRIKGNEHGRLERMYRWERHDDRLIVKEPGFLDKSETVSKWAKILRGGNPVSRQLSDMPADERALMDRLDLKSILLIPIFTHGDFWGCVVFQDSDNDRRLDDGCMDIIRSFALLCTDAVIRNEMENEIIRQSELNKKMESNILRLESESIKIYYDPLTGIYNRRFFDETLSRSLSTLSRSGGTLSLMMIDIDFFKNFNDTYGHSAGDDCIKTIAKILSGSVSRTDDFVVRYGGDEFAVVLPNSDEDGARMIAEKMLDNIRSCEICCNVFGATCTVTISIGVTTGKVKPRHRAGDFILRADELLYKSKQAGRNRYTFGLL